MDTQADVPVVGEYVEANGLNIYYEECGAGEPLLLLHGGAGVCQMWQPHMSVFAQRYRVIASDSRGHGRTANPTGQFSYRLMADDVAGLIEALGLQKPLVCGYSDGGQVALELGANYPDLASALVLAGVAFRFTDAYRKQLATFLCVEGPGQVDFDEFRATKPEVVTMLETWHSALGGRDYWQTLLLQASAMWCTTLRYGADDFAQIAVPTLVLVGDQDEFVPVEEAVEMYRLIPKAELAVLPGADHLGTLFAVEPLTCVVSDFFARRATRAE
jgi:pimeloyl-ACP methyl ester carboxylesterase